MIMSKIEAKEKELIDRKNEMMARAEANRKISEDKMVMLDIDSCYP